MSSVDAACITMFYGLLRCEKPVAVRQCVHEAAQYDCGKARVNVCLNLNVRKVHNKEFHNPPVTTQADAMPCMDCMHYVTIFSCKSFAAALLSCRNIYLFQSCTTHVPNGTVRCFSLY